MDTVTKLRDALVLAEMALDQGLSLDACIAANGPTIRMVISDALAYREEMDVMFDERRAFIAKQMERIKARH